MQLNELLAKGGFLMYPMIAMSILALYIIVDRLIYFSTFGRISDSWCQNILGALREQKIEYVREEVKKHNNIIANTLSEMFTNLHSGFSVDYVDQLIGQYAEIQVAKLQKKLTLLSVIASASTMVGFLGTVLGLISTFNVISQTTDPVTPNLIASGIYEAMITTAVGLVIGIISDVFDKLLDNAVNKKVVKLEGYANEALGIIREKRIDFTRR